MISAYYNLILSGKFNSFSHSHTAILFLEHAQDSVLQCISWDYKLQSELSSIVEIWDPVFSVPSECKM